MKRIFIVIVAFLFTIAGRTQESQNTFIPQPQSVVFQQGGFLLSQDTQVFVPKMFSADLKPIVESKFKSDAGLNLSVKTGSAKATNCILFEKVKSKAIATEGYELEVTPSKIIIKAIDYAGLFNGLQTLAQAIPLVKTDKFVIPSMSIKDNPRFHWRGVLFDVSRHFQTKEFILKQIEVLSSYKINKFHWHLTDDQGWRIEIKKYPNLTQKGAWRADRTGIAWWSRELATADEPKTVGGFYTQEEIKEVIAFAQKRNVEIIPEIDVPAHSKALIASYPELFCYDVVPDGVNFEVAVGGKAPDNALCAGKETTYAFLENVIKEVVALFPSKYFHIGGDECNKSNWKKCPHCQKVMQDHNLKDVEELQSYFIQRMYKIVSAQKKTMIAWDEVLSGKGVKGATIMAWRRGMHTPELQAPREGYPTIMTSYLHSYISRVQGPTFMEPEGPNSVLPLSVVYNHEPIPAELTKEEAHRVLGNQASLWAEFTPTESQFEYMLYPRTLASAEVSWSMPEVKNWQRFQDALEFDHFARLERAKVNFSKSMFTVYPAFAIDQLNNEAIVFLKTETIGYDIYYTLNGEEPTITNGKKYEGQFKTVPRTLLKAGLFTKKGKLLSTITEIRLK
ncbi:beta-N-acetylhexosaminidase [Flavobacterium sp. UMI-01]|uniref:beta-N-acetylhexosaminidase n=1 Tax=Flavobacterium sp. UMI-01 TaxID=1441053 RepID=UPI001C7C9EB4|nr:family 20 glycosylhydrolase [Flavobacterium sp. UMI-01]GIZ10207.1 hypothetical protein FUMI01_29330 [Flavobacterium sp. UMI-01]